MSALEVILLYYSCINPEDIDITQARLLKCSKALHRRFEPWLYSSQESRDRIVRLACLRGLNETIKLAVGTYNASPSTVTVWQRNRRGKPDRALRILTLHLATKKKKSDTFALLLELGARVDVADDNSVVATSQISGILKALPTGNMKMLHSFFTSGTAGQVQHLCVADHCLVPAIANRASVETVNLLLDHGASPDRVHPGEIRMNALSAAVKVGAIDVFTLLLNKGADLNVKKTASQAISIFEVPILAAAQAMAEFESTQMIQLCIDHGAYLDANPWFQHQNSAAFETVLLAYLDAIDDWQASFRLSPIQGVSFILHHLRQHQNDSRSTKKEKPGLDRFLIGQILEILIPKWGVKYLEVDEFFHVIKLLAEESTKFPLDILIYVLQFSIYGPLTSVASERWLGVLSILLQCRDQAEMGKLLHEFIIYCEGAKHVANRRNAEIIVHHLIQSGADINFEHPHEVYLYIQFFIPFVKKLTKIPEGWKKETSYVKDGNMRWIQHLRFLR
ncbi:unnamed protein product [Clonostachys rosea]|uniref:Uncharacterized protein n=1 Tax=Bionectria ochroleuca TaxID=29856 RepID=A0ABY6V2M6_BIOOC|nr:unnamed protein product [Clonostachys rosea]